MFSKSQAKVPLSQLSKIKRLKKNVTTDIKNKITKK